MVVIDHHSYGVYEPKQDAIAVLASTIIATNEPNYNMGPDCYEGHWGNIHNITLATADWDKILRRPYRGTLSE